MNRLYRHLAVTALLLVALAPAPAKADLPKVQHVVIVFQENRTPDNLFHGLPAFVPAADIVDRGLVSNGSTVVLTPVPLAGDYDLSHTHLSFELMYNGGKMDGADRIPCLSKPGTTSCPHPYPQLKYVNPSDVTPYRDIAINYGFANRMFQSNQGPSFPAHQFILSGTSAPLTNSTLFAAENPLPSTGAYAGCTAPSQYRVNLIYPDGIEHEAIYPCFEHEALTDLIDHPPAGARPGLTWRYYTPSEDSIWTAPDAIYHICKPSGTPLHCKGADWTNGDVYLRSAQVLTDIQSNTLQSVSWVIPTGQESDHALGNNGTGPSWVASIVNAIGKSRYWDSTVILITWDDWGGWYDHVAPPIDPTYGYYEDGFRVPLLVVSAYTAPGYVSNTTHDVGSILKFIETAFDLPLIPPGTYADSRADDLADFFDFTRGPRAFVPISAPIGASHFIHDTSRPLPPDDD